MNPNWEEICQTPTCYYPLTQVLEGGRGQFNLSFQ